MSALRILAISLLAAVALLPSLAEAGIVVTDLKVGRPAPTDVMGVSSQVNYAQGNSLMFIETDSTTRTDSGDGTFIRISAYEAAQLQQGLISLDEVNQGCGGASVTAGPAGLLPLAVAGLSLLSMRRRRR